MNTTAYHTALSAGFRLAKKEFTSLRDVVESELRRIVSEDTQDSVERRRNDSDETSKPVQPDKSRGD